MTNNGSRLEMLKKTHTNIGVKQYIAASVFLPFTRLYPVSLQFTVSSVRPPFLDLLADAFPGSLMTVRAGLLLLTPPGPPFPFPSSASPESF